MSIEALKESIIKWERNAKAELFGHIALGPSDCPLCQKYSMLDADSDCMECPVAAYTGSRYCQNTPYDRVFKHAYGPSSHIPVTDEARAAIAEEVEFLKSLMDPAVIAARLEERLACPDLDALTRTLTDWQKALES